MMAVGEKCEAEPQGKSEDERRMGMYHGDDDHDDEPDDADEDEEEQYDDNDDGDDVEISHAVDCCCRCS